MAPQSSGPRPMPPVLSPAMIGVMDSTLKRLGKGGMEAAHVRFELASKEECEENER